jgi:hypothetical protein
MYATSARSALELPDRVPTPTPLARAGAILVATGRPARLSLMLLLDKPSLNPSGRLVPWMSSGRVAAVLVLGLTLWLLRSFVVPFIWATIIALSSWPLYRRFARFLPKRLQGHLTP